MSTAHSDAQRATIASIVADPDPQASLSEFVSRHHLSSPALAVAAFETVFGTIGVDQYWTLYQVARAYRSIGDSTTAFLIASRAEAMEPEAPSWHLHEIMYHHHVHQGRLAEAASVLQRHLDKSPETTIIPDHEIGAALAHDRTRPPAHAVQLSIIVTQAANAGTDPMVRAAKAAFSAALASDRHTSQTTPPHAGPAIAAFRQTLLRENPSWRWCDASQTEQLAPAISDSPAPSSTVLAPPQLLLCPAMSAFSTAIRQMSNPFIAAISCPDDTATFASIPEALRLGGWAILYSAEIRPQPVQANNRATELNPHTGPWRTGCFIAVLRRKI